MNTCLHTHMCVRACTHRKHFVGLDQNTDFLKDKVASAPDLGEATEAKPKRKR